MSSVINLVRTSASSVHAFMKEHAAVQGRMCRDLSSLGENNHGMHAVQKDSRQQQQAFKLEAFTQEPSQPADGPQQPEKRSTTAEGTCKRLLKGVKTCLTHSVKPYTYIY